jgi:hypothetical protein
MSRLFRLMVELHKSTAHRVYELMLQSFSRIIYVMILPVSLKKTSFDSLEILSPK